MMFSTACPAWLVVRNEGAGLVMYGTDQPAAGGRRLAGMALLIR